MRPGELAVVMDVHVGVGEDMSSYILSPGDSGLVLFLDGETTALLISNHVVYVESRSLEKVPIGDENIGNIA